MERETRGGGGGVLCFSMRGLTQYNNNNNNNNKSKSNNGLYGTDIRNKESRELVSDLVLHLSISIAASSSCSRRGVFPTTTLRRACTHTNANT